MATTTIHYSLFIVGLFIAITYVHTTNKVPIPHVRSYICSSGIIVPNIIYQYNYKYKKDLYISCNIIYKIILLKIPSIYICPQHYR